MARRTVLVTAATGFIGNAVARAFVRAGWETYGLIRNKRDKHALRRDEIIPIVGTWDGSVRFKIAATPRHGVFDVLVCVTDSLVDRLHYERLIELMEDVTIRSRRENVQTLTLFTSCAKDYGETYMHGDSSLTPLTEESLIDPRSGSVLRAYYVERLLTINRLAYRNVTVVRPVNVYGYGASHYGELFAKASQSTTTFEIPLYVDPNSILHGIHVDDCAEAYVALAEHPNRQEVVKQAFNVSGREYETVNQVCKAIAESYNLTLRYGTDGGQLQFLNYSQWVSSEKLRSLTGWHDKRPIFSENINLYRQSYEAAVKEKDPNVTKIRDRYFDLCVSFRDLMAFSDDNSLPETHSLDTSRLPYLTQVMQPIPR